jgi:superfamily II DNA or RNA helicase
MLHLVEVAYNDGEQPLEETLVWEREPGARLIAPGALPDPLAGYPMPHDDLAALVRACRWTARTPFVDPDASGPVERLPITAPFHGAVQTEDYQLYPLLKALRMPRVSLLLADDVGLGKTVETALILTELLLRRRIRRVLILTPASLRVQWRDELWSKFSLPFEIVDRDSTAKLRRQLGVDANPWRSHSRIIASYHYLKQPDVLEEFRAASQPEPGSAHLPWDLLIVDEAHNLTPAPFGEESDLCKMLRQLAPLFEHRIFATATPHNGHTRSFTGLLEMLDPVRFSQTDELKPAERDRVSDVLVRRLKREINARSNPKRFCERMPPEALILDLHPAEAELMRAYSGFREGVRGLMKGATRKRRLAGNFAIEILGKRLLSCPVAFAESWHRCKAGMGEESLVTEAEVLAARKSVSEETADDREMESRTQTASVTVGAWLKPLREHLQPEIGAIDMALEGLGLTADKASDRAMPVADSRYEAVRKLIKTRLRDGKGWRDDERLVIFTEYKTTLDYLLRRLRSDWAGDAGRFLCLYGGMDDAEREDIKRAFNDASSDVRILVATDAASEGLNLQETARYMLHFDVPWNPARVEQRNGRLDRHGQARDVSTWHFLAQNDQDLAFLDLVVRKVDAIREDLGSTGEVFDEITYRRLIEGVPLEEVRKDLDLRIEAARKQADIPRDDTSEIGRGLGADPAGDLKAIASELDFDPLALHETLDSAMAMRAGRPRISPPDADRFCQIVQPHPPAWSGVIDDSVRMPAKGGVLGPMPRLTFDADAFVVKVNGRPVFRPLPDALLMHLAHPLLQKGLSALTRQRFPGGDGLSCSRWTVATDPAADGMDALILLTVEELAVNELRETFHHWVRTWSMPVRKGKLAGPLPHVPASRRRRAAQQISEAWVGRGRDLWSDVEGDIKDFLKRATADLGGLILKQVELDRKTALEDENKRYQSRQGELSTLIEGNTMKRLEREIGDLRIRRQQGLLFDEQNAFDELDRGIEQKEEELKRRTYHYEDLRQQLTRERQRIVAELIPRRYALRGTAQIMPVAVEILFPGGQA